MKLTVSNLRHDRVVLMANTTVLEPTQPAQSGPIRQYGPFRSVPVNVLPSGDHKEQRKLN